MRPDWSTVDYANPEVSTCGPAAVLPALSSNPAAAAEDSKKDIFDTAAGADEFEALVKAAKAGALVETLNGEGPFAVFAPTDEAFAKLPKDKLDALVNDKGALTGVLTHHVVPGKVSAADSIKLTSAKTMQGQEVKIVVKDGKVSISGASVVKTDIVCIGRVMHVTDALLLRPER